MIRLLLIVSLKTGPRHFDTNKGGIGNAPKFMMPNNYQFLMRYGYQYDNLPVLEFVKTTLTKMAYGGVYDQIGGGFSRYSVDDKWHVPHFEKMLYDNGQLVSLYSDAYALTNNDLYKQVVVETLEFIALELTDHSGGFYSSLDADSLTETEALEEGAFYVRTKDALQTHLAEDFELFSDYYNINGYGYWEHKNYVLIRKESDDHFILEHSISMASLQEKKHRWKTVLLNEREKRARPRLDDKILTSWNALMLKGYIDAYRVLGNDTYLKTALKNAHFIINNQLKEDGSLFHNYKNGTASIPGFLEDYATTTEAFISLYEVTLDQQWLKSAKALTDYAFDAFYNESSQLFQFTSKKEQALVVKTFEYRDNVIPASNSIMAKNLFKLALYFDNQYYYKTATAMLHNVKPEMSKYGSAFSNWLDLMLNYTKPFYEVAIVGEQAIDKASVLNTHYIPNKIVAGSTTENELPLLKNRFSEGETFLYVCENNACKLPTTSTIEAINLIKR
ncbi:thioredoxin domain-containing protein [Lacinutrix neustonica]|uniref:thioredoxin domain-containing protein n=1 Tax=Lacinutrix neustonica TaxID=2980107 RepID=UPI0028BEB924|nr:thioredoxin domain-containing protein [Lacinutrix neustonica]